MTLAVSRLKIIAIGYYTYPTGLTRVMQSIMTRLADRHEIHYLGIGYGGEPISDRGLTIYPTNPLGGDVFAAFQAKKLIEEVDPNLVFILHDIWMFDYYLRILGPYRDPLRIIAYIPLDGNIANEEEAASLAGADCVAVYTDWAKREFENAFERLRNKRGDEFPPVEVIPHGVERNRFFPFPELVAASFSNAGRAKSKREVFGDFPGLEHSFIVLNACRPDKRKRVDLTIEGFAKFASDKPANVRLCLHHAIMGETEREQTSALISALKIENRVFFNPFGDRAVNDDALNLLYNACDVGINTSMGEGWGLVSFEHGATGAAQIVPDHSACRELWGESGELIPIERSFKPEFSVLELGEVSTASVAEAIDRLYHNQRRCQTLGQTAFAASQNPEYSWDRIAQQFESLFLEKVMSMSDLD
ncbi:MAG: glycosyltransferase family 4 protein [Acidobacteriota bacterium]